MTTTLQGAGAGAGGGGGARSKTSLKSLRTALIKPLCCRTYSRALARARKVAVAGAKPKGSCL